MTDDHRKLRLIGRAPVRTLVKLVIASLIVGIVLAAVGVSPIGFWRSVIDGLSNLVSALGNSFVEIVVNLATYLVFGAAIVVPVWLIARLLSGARDRGPRE